MCRSSPARIANPTRDRLSAKVNRHFSSGDPVKRQTEDEFLQEEFRYYTPEGIIREFRTKRDKRVIAAVMRWLSMNSVVGWRFKGKSGCHITTSACPQVLNRNLDKYDVIVLDKTLLDHAEKVLIGKKP